MTKKKDMSLETIDFVLLDMDEKLLDKALDDYFWEEFVPQHAQKRDWLCQ